MTNILKIYRHADPILRTKCRNIDRVEHWVLNLANDMWETMLSSKMLGLAANQVGMDYRMITVRGDQFEGPMINPVITNRSKERFHYLEKCVSMPGYGFDTGIRSKNIKVDYFDLAGHPNTVELSDMTSVLVQHEVEHLDGVIFTDYLDERLRGE